MALALISFIFFQNFIYILFLVRLKEHLSSGTLDDEDQDQHGEDFQDKDEKKRTWVVDEE